MVCVARHLVCIYELHDSGRPLVPFGPRLHSIHGSLGHVNKKIPRDHACTGTPSEDDLFFFSRQRPTAALGGTSDTFETWYVIMPQAPILQCVCDVSLFQNTFPPVFLSRPSTPWIKPLE